MDGHFRAFSFVDKIHAIEAGKRIRGHYHIPGGLRSFPVSLVAEAIGQTAAWAAMAAADFQRRPVAGLAEKVELLSEARPGATLEIMVELQSVEDDAISYDGVAYIDDREVVRLSNCVGPMVPLEEFDSIESVSGRFRLLIESGAVPGVFGGVAPVELRYTESHPGHRLSAELRARERADFFADHFPRRPVLPGALLMDAKLRLASSLMREAEPPTVGCAWFPAEVRNMKLRSFVEPGETLEIEARLEERADSSAWVTVQSKRKGRSVGSARVLLEEKEVG